MGSFSQDSTMFGPYTSHISFPGNMKRILKLSFKIKK